MGFGDVNDNDNGLEQGRWAEGESGVEAGR